MKEIIINKDEDDIIVALLENGKLVEEYDNINNAKTLEGNIYCGIVRNVLPNMQSAFIDIGESKNAFIHIKDIIPKISEVTGNKEKDYSKYKMKDFVKQKEPILVQIKKDKESLKGARVSKDISLVGRFCVLLINVNFITVSQKIESKEEKERLKNVANEILRLKRIEAHQVFDAYWQKMHISRTKAYQWLARELKLSEEETHIGGFEIDTCQRVIDLCRAKMDNK